MVLAGVMAVAVGLVSPAAAATPYCGIWWGSLPEVEPGGPVPEGAVVDVRTGQHDCFDRLVVDLSGATDAYDARYVPRLTAQGSGEPVPLRGGAVLRLIVQAPAYDDARRPTFLPSDPAEVVDVSGHRTLQQVAWAGSFEGQTSLGLGTRARLPFRVFVLSGNADSSEGARLVVDVAHEW
ncbi:hypothetical protein HGI15_09265 [Modestobacter lapidis]|nr:hypothetical protein [Modestobacter lapidis]